MREAATAGSAFAERLARRIAADGPIPVSVYMAEANAHYYATRDPFGAAGDFVTAPEISQMFGELVGAWLGDLWLRAGRPQDARYVEFGPGRGTLAADALRVLGSAGLKPTVDLVETSPMLQRMQAERLPQARWHSGVDSLPESGPLLIVANEFFDALPVRQWVKAANGWHERLVDLRGEDFVPVSGPRRPDGAIPPALRNVPAGSVIETSPAAAAIVQAIALRIARQGGVALIIDYGHAATAIGDTLQAVRGHRHADRWREPGEADLTAHVDFEALGDSARRERMTVFGPVDQGQWLKALGIDARAAALARAAPERTDEIAGAMERLTGPGAMGKLFKVMALVSSSWSQPAGF